MLNAFSDIGAPVDDIQQAGLHRALEDGDFFGRNDDDKRQKSDRLCDVQVVKRKVLEGNNNKTS